LPREETRKMGVLGGGAAQNTHFSGILPFPLQGFRGGQVVEKLKEALRKRD
jgi:hypothetical protein